MRLLREYTTFDKSNIVENNTKDRTLSMKGVFIQAEVRNHNERVYPINEIQSAVQHVMERIEQGESVLGECDHPDELTINLDRVSHAISEMWMDSNNGCGKLKIVNTPTGQIIKTLLESDIKLGVSSRGAGEVDHTGIVSGYEIVTVDIVAQPSAPNAYPKAIYESLYNMRGSNLIERIATDVAYEPNNQGAQKHLTKEIVQFINELNK